MNLPSRKWIIGIVIVLCILVFFKAFITPDPKKMSPKEIVNLYYKLRNTGNIDLLQQIIYFPEGTTEQQKHAKIKTVLAGAEEKGMMRLFGVKRKAKDEEYLDETTAKVSVVSTNIFRIGKQFPEAQIILKKNEGIWKYCYNMGEMRKDELLKRLRTNPEDVDLYFYLAVEYISENTAKSDRFYFKYYELAANGFWVDEDFLKSIEKCKKKYEDTETYEQEMLAEINATPANHILSKTIEYQRLCQLFIEKKDYKKASSYLMLAEETLKKDNSEYNYWKENLDKVKMELQLHIEGKYVDPLDEIEAKRNK